MKPERVILHLDMDAFFAAVEVRENPELAGKPVIVGHPGKRGVVATCSYEAREFGIHSAMPSVTAVKLCPDAVWVRGRHKLYAEISRSVRAIMQDASPMVEPLSIDEAFIDLTGIAPDLEAGANIGAEIKNRILEVEQLTSSVGVSPNKFLAKVASDMEKPDGLVILSREAVPERLWPMKVEKLWGVGPKTAERLRQGGITRIGQLAEISVEALESLVGRNSAAHLQALSRGEDDRPVRTGGREAKSISEERTYGDDLTEPAEIDRALLARSEGVARELRKDALQTRTVHIKVRTGDYTTWTRAHTLSDPTDLAEVIVQAARDMFRHKINLRGKGIRLLGVGVSHLEPAGSGQHSLFTDPEQERAQRMTRAADAVRDRLGDQAITRARLLRKKK